MSDLLMRRERPLAKMVFAKRVPNTTATSDGQWKARSVSPRGSIDQSIYSFLQDPASAQPRQLSVFAHHDKPISQAAFANTVSVVPRYLSPLTINFQAMRAVRFARATATSLGFLCSRSFWSHGDPFLPRPARTCLRTEVAPLTSTLRKCSSPARVMPPGRARPAVE